MLFIVSGRDHDNGLAHRLEIRPRHRAHYESLGDDLSVILRILGALTR